jgi:hypothetical protein
VITMEDQPVSSEYEPTILDWVKSIFKLKPIPIPEPVEVEGQVEVALPPREIKPTMEELKPEFEPAISVDAFRISAKHIRLPVALLLGLFAQFALSSKPRNVIIVVAIYLLAGFIAGWATWVGDFGLPLPASIEDRSLRGSVRLPYLGAGVVLMLFTYFASRENRFTAFNLIFWMGSLTCLMVAFWEGEPPFQALWAWVKSVWRDKKVKIDIQPWHLLVTATVILVVFFRTTQIERVPIEMWSDQAEKLWDVMDVMDGEYSIFFPRNTGREPMQFYMAAAIIKFFDTGISFNTLKITTIIAGLLTLPYLYLFAKEFGGRYVGLMAVLLAGIGYWPNVISRLGLRFPLYPLFVAPAIYYLMRGLRLRRRNDFLLCGLATGLGLLGYSPARVIPIAVMIGVLLFTLGSGSRSRRREAFIWLVIAGVIGLVVFIPLLAAVSYPDRMALYLNRMVSRVSSLEQAIPGSPVKIFFENLWRGLRMFSWDAGEIWVITIPFRPILDWVTGAFFHLGAVILFIRFLRTRRWQDLFILILIPILMLPSILSIAFPGENPAPNRAAGAIIPVFTIAAIPLVLIMQWAQQTFKNIIVRGIALATTLFLILGITSLNYNLVFKVFVDQHHKSTWNTSEIGRVIRGFASTIGSYETTHVIPYPHWVDTRLVGITAGDPSKDYGVWPQDLDKIPPEPDRPQLFIFKPEDTVGFQRLRELYPNGVVRRGESAVEGRDFMLYYVFPDESIELDITLPEE